MPGPLAHLRVVDLTDLRGALAGRLLADLGAAVLKVEPPQGDRGRMQPPFAGNVADPERSLAFLYRNANKHALRLDLHDVDGARRFAALCDGADLLLENFGPNRRQVLDLAPEAVRARFPHLIHVVISDFGLAGPRAHWRAEPLVAFAASGGLHVSGFADRPPCALPGYAAHDAASVMAVAGALAALLVRAGDGLGQTVEVSAQEAAIAGFNPWGIPLADYNRHYPMLPTAPPRNADGNYLVLPASDGYVRILPAGLRHWRGLVDILRRHDVFAGEEWDYALYRLVNHDVIRTVAADALRDRSRAEIFAEARQRNVPLAPINTPDEFVDHEQTRKRGFFRRSGFPQLGDAPFAVAPFNFSRTPVELRCPAPADPHPNPPPWPEMATGEGAGDQSPPPRAGEGQGGGASNVPPLRGLRAVIFGYAVVTPELGWLLAELGAEVLRIESRAHLDLLRTITIEPDTPNRAFTFNDASRGQRSVCLDLRQPRARELALRLCAAADVVAENFRGGVLASCGLDYDSVRQLRPDVIYLSSQGFGADGPLAGAPSFGPLNAAFAGTHWLWNFADAPYPAGTSLNHPDHLASKLATVAVLAAIEHRRRSGEGQFIEMAQTEAAAFLTGELYLRTACTGAPARPAGNAAEHAAPHGVYPCTGEDEWIAIAVVGDDAWRRFARCLGWQDDARLATLEARLAARDTLDARVAEWTRERDPEAAAAQLQAAGVSALRVLSPDALRTDAHLLARGAIVTVDHPEIGAERHIANPIRLSRTRCDVAGAAPLLGADTEAVLVEILGLDRDEARQLIADGICA